MAFPIQLLGFQRWYRLVAQRSSCPARATNTLEPHRLRIPKTLRRSPSVWTSAKVSDSFPESPIDSRAFLRMTRILPHVQYKYKAKASQLIHSLYILTALKLRHLIICEPRTNSSISIDSLCDTLISIICAKIASRSRRLSSYRTQQVSWWFR